LHCYHVYLHFSGPVSSILVNRYGSRPVVIFGGFLSGIGLILASFSTSLIQLYICVGVIAGFGFSMNLQPSVIVIGKYFLKKRPIANGLAMAGSPVILSTLAPLNQFLFDEYGWRGSFLILGATLLNCCVAGALFRPIGPKTLKAKKGKNKPIQDMDPEKVNMNPEEEPQKGQNPPSKAKESCFTKFNKVLDLTLFKHRGFLIYLIGNVLMFLAFYAPIVFLAPYGKHLGVDEYSAAFLLSILAIVDMIARPATGYVGLVVYSVFFGLAFGMVCALLFETLMDLVGAKRFSSAVGLVTIVECVPLLLGPPIGGAIVDTFGDYKYMFFECGAIMVFAGLFLFAGNFYNYRMLRKEAKSQNQERNDIEMKDGASLNKKDYDQVCDGEKPKNGNEVPPSKCEDVNGSGH
ncbi:unnamed protein product, partial [Ranitomeya imitator]